MPTYASPQNLPPNVERVAAVLGMNEVRLAILAAVANHPEGVTSGRITEELQVSSRTVTRHLADLLEAQWVVTEVPPGERAGRHLRYRTNAARIRAELADITDLIAPEQ